MLMSTLRKWISMLVIMAFVVSTMPMSAHASVSHGHAKKTHIEKTEVSQSAPKHHNCHHTDKVEPTAKTAKADKDCAGKGCCEKNCKCIGGMCGSGSPSVLGAAGLNLNTPSINTTYFGLAENLAAADHDGRLKRPPRA